MAARFLLTLVITSLVGLLALSDAAQAESPAARLRQATRAMDEWLGDDANAHQWREYLRSGELAAELDKQDSYDRNLLREVLARFRSGAPGLELSPFVAVSQSLAAWDAELELAARIRSAQDRFRPVTEDQVRQALSSLQTATHYLDQKLSASGQNGFAWRDYLGWNAYLPQVFNPEKPDVKTLGETYRRLTENHAGLERPVFGNVASAVRKYVDVAAVAGLSDQQKIYKLQMEALARNLERYTNATDEEASWNIGQRLGWLEGTGQTPDLVSAVRNRYSHANVYLALSASMLDAALQKPITRTDPVNENMMGVRITGTGRTSGRVGLELVPSQGRAMFDTVFRGQTVSSTLGAKGPARVYSSGLSNFVARKRITFDEYGLRTAPAWASANTATNINRIESTRGGMMGRVVKKVAAKKAGQQKGQASQMASRRMEQRLSQSFEQEANPQLREANQNYYQKFRLPLERRREFPQQLHFSTTTSQLNIVGRQANRFQLGAPTSPPPIAVGHDLAMQVHESLINNLATVFLGGRTFTSEKMQERVKEWGGEVPPTPEGEEEEPWSITLSRVRPMTIKLDEGRFKITIRGRSYTSGDRSFEAMNIGITYQVERFSGGVNLTRVGDVEFLPPRFVPGKSKLTVGDIALQTILQKKVDKLDKEATISEPFYLPKEMEKLGSISVAELALEEGWLVLGLRRLAGDRITRYPVVVPPSYRTSCRCQ